MITREEAIKKHREMWNWLADKMEESGAIVLKHMYFLANNIPDAELPACECFCCEYAFITKHGNCDDCPLIWDDRCCTHENIEDGLFDFYHDAVLHSDVENAIQYARLIANLPEKRV